MEFIMLGNEKKFSVCPSCVIAFREAGRRMVVMAEVCQSVADHLTGDTAIITG